MAGIRGMFCHRRPPGDCYLQDPDVVYLYLLPNDGVSGYHLYGYGLLAKYKKIYSLRSPESPEVSVNAYIRL